MKFIALVSGGKDSIYSILQAVRNGHELVGCLHLGAPETTEEESYMYQTAASEVVKTQVEECLGVPLVTYQRRGRSIQTGLVYESGSSNGRSANGNTQEEGHDEVEDLYRALLEAQDRFRHGFQAVSSGAILSNYQRVRIEHVCARLGLTSLSYLWRLAPQKELLQKMLDDGVEAVLVKTACPPGLVPRKHLNKSLRFLWSSGLLEQLHQRYQFHVCGEGGEYESLVLDSPLHRKKLVLDEVEVIVANEDDGVGELRIRRWHVADKSENDVPILESSETETTTNSTATTKLTNTSVPSVRPSNAESSGIENHHVEKKMATFAPIVALPHIHYGMGGLLHFSEIMAPIAAASSGPHSPEVHSEEELAVQEALDVFSILERSLERCSGSARDVLFVHLYLSEISHFASINAHYEAFFGSLLPPSRSCVAVGCGVLPGGRRVLLDCIVQLGSGDYMRSSQSQNPYALAAHATKTSKLREVLHVQSISNWAPVCVGPYSQVNTLRSGLQLLAGQIGLIPCTMTLQSTWMAQLDQCWKNVAAVLDSLDGGSLRNLLGSLIYISDEVYKDEMSLELLESATIRQMRTNGSIVAGRVDSLVDLSEAYGGYEDQGTWQEMRKIGDDEESNVVPCPTLIVTIPEMPKGAAVEVEVITSTTSAANSLETQDAQHSMEATSREVSNYSGSTKGWQTGHDFHTSRHDGINEMMHINSCARVIGFGSAGIALCVASLPIEPASSHHAIHLESLIKDMFFSVEKALLEAISGMDLGNSIHIRVFFVASEQSSGGRFVPIDDGVQLRSVLRSTIASTTGHNTPATTVVPVRAISTCCWTPPTTSDAMFCAFAMQILLVDPVHFETEVWIHKDR